MKKQLSITAIAATLLSLAACGDQTNTTETKTVDSSSTTTNAPAPSSSITLAPVPESPAFKDAALKMSAVKAEMKGKDSVAVSFAFDVKNYALKQQTDDAGQKSCANSKDGQHIHFIIDNKPYVALYEPKHTTTVAPNTEHTVVCFLSRSYHESIKEKSAAVVYRFKVDAAGKLAALPESKDAMLFYSRPKGDYLGADTANLLLDFYLANANLGNDMMVKADVKNETTGNMASFNLKEWKPMFIQSLGTGKCSVTLSLVDKDGKPVGNGNTITRNFNMAKQEPM